MRRHSARTLLGVALVAHVGTACITVRKPSFMQPAPERAWPAALAHARTRMSEGRFEAADSVLANFASRYPEAPEAIETAYWRALAGMDPANPHTSLSTAVTFLDAYLAGPQRHAHTDEARSLRRVAGQLVEMGKVVALAQTRDTVVLSRPQPGEIRADTARQAPDVTANNDEIKRLRDELAKANAELERIRKRLAQPPTRPPREREER